MFHWAVPWATDDIIDFAFLSLACVIVVAVPLVYGLRANLRDPLARAVVIGTGATAFAFMVSFFFTIALHAGWNPPPTTVHWMERAVYLAIAFGKFVLLLALLSAIRAEREYVKKRGTTDVEKDELPDRDLLA